MIQKCPVCGQWCEAEKKGIVDRAISSWTEAVESDAMYAENLSNKIGLKKVGSVVGGALGSYHGIVNGVFNGLLGSKYQFVCPSCGSEWEVENESDDQATEYNHELEMNALLSPVAVKNFVSTNNLPKLEEIVNRWEYVLQYDSNDGFKASACDALALYNYKVKNNKEKALDFLSRSEDLCPDESIRVTKTMLSNPTLQPEAEYDRLCGLISYYNTNYNFFFELSEIETAIEKTYNNYVSQFMAIPQHKRDVIMIVDSLASLTGGVMEGNIKVLLANNMPTGINFIEGRFMLNTPYVCHPYKPDRYLRYENHEELLFQDEMRDLQRFLGSLGAKYITIAKSDQVEKGLSGQNETVINGKVDKGLISISGNMDRSSSENLRESLKKTLHIGTEMEQGEKPEMPTEYKGWAQQISWQDFAESRFMTKIKTLSIEISTSEAKALDINKQLKVEAEISALIGKVNGDVKTSSYHASSSVFDESFVLNVEFYPLSSYKATEEQVIMSQNQNDGQKFQIENSEVGQNTSCIKKFLNKLFRH